MTEAKPPLLVAMAGLPASGKSTLARAIATELPAVALDKDVARTALFTPEWIEYSTAQDDFVFSILLEAARYHLRCSRTVILDGRPFVRHSQIEQVKKFAAQQRVRLKIILCTCPEEVILQRLKKDSSNPSANRNPELYHSLKIAFEPLCEEHLVVDTTRPLKACVAVCLDYLKT